MANIPPTKKEEMIMKVLVKRFSKQELFQELVDIQSIGMSSNMVQTSAKLIGLRVPRKTDSQYLNYAVQNYEQIKKNEFPEQFERMMALEVSVKTTELRTVRAEYSLTVPVLKSFSDELKMDIEDDIWDYDPQLEDDDTYETDVHDVQVSFDKIIMNWGDNILT